MKSKLITLVAIAAAMGSASATTIVLSGGTTGAQFVTSSGTLLQLSNASIQIGSMSANVFTKFDLAGLDTTPGSFSSVGALLGRWTNGTADTTAAATPFNGLQIWFRITTTADGGGTAYFGSTSNFPNNAFGSGDSLNVLATSLTTFNSTLSNANTAAFVAPDITYPNGHLVVGVVGVPEPSAAMLGALGALALLRRRRA